jgi:hypothetical protein
MEEFVRTVLRAGMGSPGVPAVHDENRATLEAILECLPEEILDGCLEFFGVGLLESGRQGRPLTV